MPTTNINITLDDFTGDSGSGGVSGLVPAPAAGDAAAGKFLKANGSWVAPSAGSGDVVGPASATDSAFAKYDGTTGKLLKDGVTGSTGGNETADAGKVAIYGASGQLHGSCGLIAGVYGTSSGAGAGVKGDSDAGPGGEFIGNGSGGALTVDQETSSNDIASFQNSADGTSIVFDATGSIALDGTVDGRDVATDGTKLDTIETGADVTDATNVAAAGALMASNNLSDLVSASDARHNLALDIFQIDFFGEIIQNKTYVLRGYAAYAFTITTLVIKTATGTVTANVTIDGTSVTGLSAVAVTTTESSTNATAANTVSVGQTVDIRFTSTSGVTDLYLSLLCAR